MHLPRFILTVVAGTLMGCLAAFLPTDAAHAQDRQLEEIVVTFQVRHLVSTDMFVQYDGTSIYLPLSELFDLLDLYVDHDNARRRYYGQVATSDQKFEFDLHNHTVTVNGRRQELPSDDYVLGTTDLYLRADRFETYFGLPVEFNFSDLRVTLPLNKDFPAYQKLQRSLEHKRLKAEKERLGDVKQLPYRRAMLGGAVADWSASTNPIGGGAQYFNANLGAMLFGGDLAISGTGNSETGVQSDQLTYRWHYFVDTSSIVTQVELGDLFTGAVGGPLTRRLRGAVITNKPQTQRKYFRTVSIQGHLGEGWEVELYVDNRLTDFAYTGQAGDYDFNIDVYYGASVVTLKMYGPNGEIRTEEQYIRVPYNIIPAGTFEYSTAVGKAMDDTLGGWYGQASTFFGISDRITTGVLADAPISAGTGEDPAFSGEISVKPAGNLTLNGSYSPGYLAGLDFNFNQPSLLNIDGSIAGYFENEFRNRLHQERSLLLAMNAPLKIKAHRVNLRYYVAWNTFRTNEQINMQYGFSTSFRQVSLYYLGKYLITHTGGRSLTSMISEVFTSVPLSRWLRPQFRITYDHDASEFSRVSMYLSRRVFRNGQLGLSIERDLQAKTNVFRLTFNLFTGFADFTSRAAYSNGTATINQVQRGSVRYDQEAKQLIFDRYSGVGRSTAVVRPYLDDNYNGVRDNDEQYLSGLRARVQGGRERPRGQKDRVYYYEGLNPYDEHLVRIDPISLDDPLLKPTYENYRVPLNPNMVTAIEVPLVMTGEVDGMVYRQTKAGDVGQGGIRIDFFHLGKESVTEVMSFTNGDFFYLGLLPGRYRAYIDPDQLKRYGYRCEPEYIEFDMDAVEGGAVVSDLKFTLIPLTEEAAPIEPPQE